METVKLYSFQLDFLKDLLREYLDSKPDPDTRLMAMDILSDISAQFPDKVYDISLLTGELIEIEKEV